MVAILMLYYFKFNINIKRNDSAFETTAKILKVVGFGAAALIALYFIFLAAIWINSNLGLAVFILAIFYILWAIAAYLVKYKKDLLIHIVGAYIAARIEAFVAGMSILIHTPIGLLSISLGSVTWIGLFDPRIGQIFAISLPIWVWIVTFGIISWGILSMIEKLVNTIESSFHLFYVLLKNAEPDGQNEEPKRTPRRKT